MAGLILSIKLLKVDANTAAAAAGSDTDSDTLDPSRTS